MRYIKKIILGSLVFAMFHSVSFSAPCTGESNDAYQNRDSCGNALVALALFTVGIINKSNTFCATDTSHPDLYYRVYTKIPGGGGAAFHPTSKDICN